MSRSTFLLILLGTASLFCYVAALGLVDFRKHNIPSFEVAFFAAFALYLAASALSLRQPPFATAKPSLPRPFISSLSRDPAGTRQSLVSNPRLLIILFFALLFRLTLLPSFPTLSDDMFRYIWDGRVQNNGLSPYRYAPNAVEVARLRKGDKTVWRHINRKKFVTVYPPGAQLAYATIWRVVGDNVTGFKAAFVLAELIGGVLLIGLLKHFGLPAERVVIYLWSPLLVFEVSHAGHVDGLMLPLLIAGFWARAAAERGLLSPRLGVPGQDAPAAERHKQYWPVGLWLGVATLVKLFPVLLLPALLPLAPGAHESLRSRVSPAIKTLVAFVAPIALAYAVYLLANANPIGFLPIYFGENFNMGIARFIFEVAKARGLPGASLSHLFTFGGLVGLSAWFMLKPAASARQALLRCMGLMGWFTLFTQNLFPWYLLWLLPLLALFLEPGKFLGFKLTPGAAWLIFSGTIALAYLFFINWRVVPAGQVAEYVPLYVLLLAAWLKQGVPAVLLRAQRTSTPAVQNP